MGVEDALSTSAQALLCGPLAASAHVAPLALPQSRCDNADGSVFPLALRCAEESSLADVTAWLAANWDPIQSVLLQHGALVLRGFPVPDAASFDALMESLGVPPKPYVGGAAVRTVVAGHVFTSNESPPSESIPFHHGACPRIAFFCQTPSAVGGETSVLLSGCVAARVRAELPSFAARLEAQGLLYHRVLSEHDDATSAQGRGWRSTYNASSRDDAERAMRHSGVHTWTWLPEGSLRTTTGPLPAFKTDSRSGESLFHNALVAVFLGWTDARNSGPESVRFGDGGALGADEVEAVRQIMSSLAVDIPWEAGDVMLLDNQRAMHARRPFKPPRRILAYLCV